MRFNVEPRGLDAFLGKINAAPDKLLPNVQKAVEVTTIHVRDDIREKIPSKNRYFKHLPRAIKYRIRKNVNSVKATVHTKGEQARFIGFLNNGGGSFYVWEPIQMYEKAVAGNEADFRRGIQRAIQDSLR